MIILLKTILGLIAIADTFALWNMWKDFQSTRKQDGYDELPIWRRVKFNLISFFIMSSMISFLVFLIYFTIIKLAIG